MVSPKLIAVSVWPLANDEVQIESRIKISQTVGDRSEGVANIAGAQAINKLPYSCKITKKTKKRRLHVPAVTNCTDHFPAEPKIRYWSICPQFGFAFNALALGSTGLLLAASFPLG